MRRSVPQRPLTSRRGINPTLLFFLLGLALLIVGLALPGLDTLALAGAFIVLVYGIVMAAWIFFREP
ncbi:MAG: hypothetical protein AABX53_01890 [Nanoarchaeota archaeon]